MLFMKTPIHIGALMAVCLLILSLHSCQKSEIFSNTTTVSAIDTTQYNTNGKTSGTLSVSVNTSSTNSLGSYAPKNVVAIWIETNSGVFVKSLLVMAQTRKSDLIRWKEKSKESVVDATTGATQNSFGKRSCRWYGTDLTGTVVTDGTYRLCMELTDKNAAGNYSVFTFTKGSTESFVVPVNKPSFSSVQIRWSPDSGNPDRPIGQHN